MWYHIRAESNKVWVNCSTPWRKRKHTTNKHVFLKSKCMYFLPNILPMPPRLDEYGFVSPNGLPIAGQKVGNQGCARACAATSWNDLTRSLGEFAHDMPKTSDLFTRWFQVEWKKTRKRTYHICHIEFMASHWFPRISPRGPWTTC